MKTKNKFRSLLFALYHKTYVPFAYTAKNSKLWETDVTLAHLQPVMDALGCCWFDLGIALDLNEAVVCNIESDYRWKKEKAIDVIVKWKDMVGKDATMGRLVVTLHKIGQNGIVHSLLGM